MLSALIGIPENFLNSESMSIHDRYYNVKDCIVSTRADICWSTLSLFK